VPKDEGGYAFPKADLQNPNGTPSEWRADGMTLRQWYAGLAMQAFLTRVSESIAVPFIAGASFEIADAMIEEGKKNDEGTTPSPT
jgi:hypothetical protein